MRSDGVRLRLEQVLEWLDHVTMGQDGFGEVLMVLKWGRDWPRQGWDALHQCK